MLLDIVIRITDKSMGDAIETYLLSFSHSLWWLASSLPSGSTRSLARNG